jgi:hypothetical protein
LFHSASRLSRSQSRRPLGAVLALLYLWGFVALGLTHMHAPAPASCRHSSGAILAADPDAPVIGPAVAAANERQCVVCAVAHATVVALARPPAAAHTPALVRTVSTSSSTPAPRRSISSSRSRAPPQA